MQFSPDPEALLTSGCQSVCTHRSDGPLHGPAGRGACPWPYAVLKSLILWGTCSCGREKRGVELDRQTLGFSAVFSGLSQPTELWRQHTLHEVGHKGQVPYPHVGPWLGTDPERGPDLGRSSSLQLGSLWKEGDRCKLSADTCSHRRTRPSFLKGDTSQCPPPVTKKLGAGQWKPVSFSGCSWSVERAARGLGVIFSVPHCGQSSDSAGQPQGKILSISKAELFQKL